MVVVVKNVRVCMHMRTYAVNHGSHVPVDMIPSPAPVYRARKTCPVLQLAVTAAPANPQLVGCPPARHRKPNPCNRSTSCSALSNMRLATLGAPTHLPTEPVESKTCKSHTVVSQRRPVHECRQRVSVVFAYCQARQLTSRTVSVSAREAPLPAQSSSQKRPEVHH